MDAIERAREMLVQSPFFNLPNVGVLLIAPDSLQIYRANQRALEILGYEAETLQQMTFYDLCLDPPEQVRRYFEELQSEKPFHLDVRTASSEWRIVEAVVTFSEEVQLFRLLFADLTGVRLAWRVLTRLVPNTARLTGETYLKALVRELAALLRVEYAYVEELVEPDRVRGLAFWSKENWQPPLEYRLENTPCEGVINRAACLYARSVQSLFPKDEELKALGAESYAGIPLRDTRGRPIGILWVCGVNPLPDVPELLEIMESVGARASSEIERMRMEQELQIVREQMLQAQRMESIGQMAGGVAHDFNNMLTAILGYIELAQGELDPQHRAYQFLESAIRGVEKASEFTRQLTLFARRQPMQIQTLQLNAIIQEALQFAQRWLPANVQVRTFLAEDLWLIEGDASQLTQVLTNLFLNARDAMPQGGVLTIETQNVVLDQDYARRHYEVVPGEYVMLSVSETGIGMSPSVQKRIFEPFFTTKPQGQGTGLGLTVVYSVVKQRGGHIWVYSEEGRGTTFKICLPRAAHESLAPTLAVPPAITTERGSETILLVEDEADVRTVAVEALRARGYTVLEAATPTEALQLAQENKIDLLVTDVVLPVMSGRELAEVIKRLQPQIRVLYVSGYTENTIVHYGVVDAGVHFLPKPYTPSQLAAKVRQVLDEEREE